MAEEEEKKESMTILAPTKMIYLSYEGNWETECEAKVIAVQSKDNDVVEVYLDQTVMHAQGGGQPTDQGTIEADSGTLHVSKILLDRDTGVASHTGKLDGELAPGQLVRVKVDPMLRRILSECHTAGHVVDSAMARCGKFLKPSKAYHFLEGPYVEYEGSIPIEERDTVLKDLQTAFCQLIDENIDTKIELMSKKEADEVCNRQSQNFDVDIFADKHTKLVRVVTVAGYPCPCGGTHVRSTGILKSNGWGITGIKSKKGVVRVKYGQNPLL